MAGKTSPPAISRYLLMQAALGCALGAFFPFLLWTTDTGSFGALLSGADKTTLVMVVASSMMTFCPLAVATAIGLLSSRDR